MKINRREYEPDHSGIEQVIGINIGVPGAGSCRRELCDPQQLHAIAGVAVPGIDVRPVPSAAADLVCDRGVTYPSIYDPPGRSLDQLHGYPRNTVPSTIVLDRQHRVAAVFLTAVHIGQLGPWFNARPPSRRAEGSA